MSGVANALCQLNSPLGDFMKEANESITKGEHQLHPPPWAGDLTRINRWNGFDLLKIEVSILFGYRSRLLDFSESNSTMLGGWAPRRHTEFKEDPHKAPAQSSPRPPSLSWMMPCGILPRMAQWKISCNSRHLPWPLPVAFTRLPLKYLQFTLRSFSFWLENKNPTNYFNCLKQFYYVVIITLPCNYLLCEYLSPTPPFSTPDSSSLKELPHSLDIQYVPGMQRNLGTSDRPSPFELEMSVIFSLLYSESYYESQNLLCLYG